MSKSNEITLPAIRGLMGNWVYYSCLMSTNELSKRVRFADEIHKNKQLSDMIQRRLKSDRSEQIAEYLRKQPERFFNSLVVATYGGEPNWYPLSDVQATGSQKVLNDLDHSIVGSIGFLKFRGDETLFALDGQHRLAGIKKAASKGLHVDPPDDISVIFVAHKNSEKGLERTRRLFTTLNKTAKPVKKGDIIALDEDDVMALSVRWLIEETELFSKDRIAFVATNNMPVKNTSSLTTIGNLYDLLSLLFCSVESDLKSKKANLVRRPNDELLHKYFSFSKRFFEKLKHNFNELEEFFSATNTEYIVKKYRNNTNGGSALFRPIGLDIFVRIIATLTKKMPLSDAITLASRLPTNLSSAPFAELLWDTKNKTILNAHKVTLREVLLYMIDTSKYSDTELLIRYRKETGIDDIELPSKLI